MKKEMKKSFCIVVSLMFTAIFFLASSAMAQEYPTKPIEIVCPYGAGGGSDMHVRAIVAVGSKYLEQALIPVIRSGATGTVGTAYVATSKPDGHTLLIGEQGSVIIQPMLQSLPYTAQDLIPIGQITAVPLIIFVHSSSPWKNLKEFIDDAKTRPKKIRYASAGMYGTDHLTMEALSKMAGIQLTHVPMGGAGPATAAVLGKHVEAAALNPATVSPHLEAGNVRALASSANERIKVKGFEKVLTMKELGFDYQMYLWWGLYAPKGTPQPIIQKLRISLKQIWDDKSFQRLMGRMGFMLSYLSGEELEKRYDKEVADLQELIKIINP